MRARPALAAMFLAFAGLARADDIVWPTYAQASLPSDASLDCTRLRATIAHVTSDLVLLTRARDQVDAIVRNGFANESSVGRLDNRHFDHASYRSGQEGYVKAHEQIVTSRKIAQDRLDALNALLPACKEPAP